MAILRRIVTAAGDQHRVRVRFYLNAVEDEDWHSKVCTQLTTAPVSSWLNPLQDRLVDTNPYGVHSERDGTS